MSVLPLSITALAAHPHARPASPCLLLLTMRGVPLSAYILPCATVLLDGGVEPSSVLAVAMNEGLSAVGRIMARAAGGRPFRQGCHENI